MKKRIRKKLDKRRAAAEAEIGASLSAVQQLQAALDDLRHSAAYLLDTALTQAQLGALALVRDLRERAEKVLAALGQPMAPTADRAHTHGADTLPS